jgi:hypothetical protein
MARINEDGSLEEEELVREGGVFVSRNGGHEAGGNETRIADDYIEDQGTGDGVPGTIDDLPYDYGLEQTSPADQLLRSADSRMRGHGGTGETGAAEDIEPPPLGAPEERELWRKQRGLIQESGDEAARYAGLSDAEAAALDEASGEDAADVLPDAPSGTSATGAE